MTYQTTITSKGQITIPKKIREILGLKPFRGVTINVESRKKEAIIKPAEDILDLAESFKPRRRTSALKTRETMEKIYKRV